MGKSYLRTPKTFYIKDLLKHADVLEFESTATFIIALSERLVVPSSGRCIIPVESLQDIDILLHTMQKSGLHKISSVVLEMTSDIFMEYIHCVDYQEVDPDRLSYEINLTTTISKKWSMGKLKALSSSADEFLTNNFISRKVHINADNYKTEFYKIVDEYCATRVRLFDIRFDYISLNTLKFSDMVDLEFGMNHLTKWTSFSRGFNEKIELLRSYNIVKRYYVSADLDLKLDSTEGRTLLNLRDISDIHLEDIPYSDLSKVTSVFDMDSEDLFFPVKVKQFNGYWVHLNQNEEIECYMNEIPYITCVVNSMMEGII